MDEKTKSEKLKSYDAIYKRMGENIQYLREKRDLTQKALAHMCGTSQSIISYAESGTRRASQETINKLCSIFDVTLEDLIIQDYQKEFEDGIEPDISEDNSIFKCCGRTYYCYYLMEYIPKDKRELFGSSKRYKETIKTFRIVIHKAISYNTAKVDILFENKKKRHTGIIEMDGKYAYLSCHEFGRDYFLQIIFYYARDKTSKKYRGGLALLNMLDVNRRPVSQYCIITTNAIKEANWTKLKKMLQIQEVKYAELKEQPFSNNAVLRITKKGDESIFRWLYENKYV